MLPLAAGCESGLKKQHRRSFYSFCCSLSAPFDLQAVPHQDNPRGKRALHTHATFSYLLPDLKSLTTGTSVFLFMGPKRHLSTLSWHQLQCVVWLWAAKWLVFRHSWDTSGQHRRKHSANCDLPVQHVPRASRHCTPLTLPCIQGHAPPPHCLAPSETQWSKNRASVSEDEEWRRLKGSMEKGGAFSKRPSSSLRAIERCIVWQHRDESLQQWIRGHFSYH